MPLHEANITTRKASYWSLIWWKDVMSLADQCILLASCKVNEGTTMMFWKVVCDLGIYAAYHNFYTPLSTIAFAQLQELSALILGFNVSL